MADRYLRIEEVALTIGCSTKTVNMWYIWKKRLLNQSTDGMTEKELKKHEASLEYAKMLPDFIQQGDRQIRYWKYDDIWLLIEFKNKIPHGRGGILGDTTQKYERERKKRCKEQEKKD